MVEAGQSSKSPVWKAKLIGIIPTASGHSCGMGVVVGACDNEKGMEDSGGVKGFPNGS